MPSPTLFEFNRQFEQALALIEQTPWLVLRVSQINQLFALHESSLGQVQRLPFKLELDGMAQGLLSEFLTDKAGCTGFDPQDLKTFHFNFQTSFNKNDLQKFEFLIVESLFRLGDTKNLITFMQACIDRKSVV